MYISVDYPKIISYTDPCNINRVYTIHLKLEVDFFLLSNIKNIYTNHRGLY